MDMTKLFTILRKAPKNQSIIQISFLLASVTVKQICIYMQSAEISFVILHSLDLEFWSTTQKIDIS